MKLAFCNLYIEIIKSLYRDNEACIKLEKTGRPFLLKRGVKQGDPLSPALYAATLEFAMKQLDWGNKDLNINGLLLTNLRFADIIILANSIIKLQEMLKSLKEKCSEADLTINKCKTKILSNSTKSTAIIIDDEPYFLF